MLRLAKRRILAMFPYVVLSKAKHLVRNNQILRYVLDEGGLASILSKNEEILLYSHLQLSLGDIC